MGWQAELLEATSDLEITPQEVVGMAEGVIESAARGMIIVGMMTMFVKGFYDTLGLKKLAKQEEEVLEMVEEIF